MARCTTPTPGSVPSCAVPEGIVAPLSPRRGDPYNQGRGDSVAVTVVLPGFQCSCPGTQPSLHTRWWYGG
ncbi:hypothetical protein J6590_064722 [Homalodisca vitripennis]|nr:hypothetical protein J6590_064722 [Homalodisca vitripennis]